MPYRILVTGSRNWTDKSTIHEALMKHSAGRECVIVHGACPTGADRIASDWARPFSAHEGSGITEEPYPADWLKGRAEGPMRNQRMVDLGADVCLAFLMKSSKGTRDCANRARLAKIDVIEFWAEED